MKIRNIQKSLYVTAIGIIPTWGMRGGYSVDLARWFTPPAAGF
ncbi:MAG: hypothetical protein ACPGLY_19220 [Rubripirellula sp.]